LVDADSETGGGKSVVSLPAVTVVAPSGLDDRTEVTKVVAVFGLSVVKESGRVADVVVPVDSVALGDTVTVGNKTVELTVAPALRVEILVSVSVVVTAVVMNTVGGGE
jgi:hypothetical protein